MNTKALRWVVLVAALGMAGPVEAQAPTAECGADPPDVAPLADRAAALESFERLPESCLKALFVVCADAAGRQLLDMGSAAMCSISYEALLKRGFGGDFHALMGWWRARYSSSSPLIHIP